MTTLNAANSQITSLFQAMQAQPDAYTTNGMPSLSTSGNDLLDLFGIIGNRNFSFDTNLSKIKMLFATDKILLGRLFLWSRDCRGGAGHRDPIRSLVLSFENQDPEYVIALLRRLPELGYYKDLIFLYEKSKNKQVKQAIVDLFIVELANAVKEKRYSLLAKYLPRKGELSVEFRNELKMTPKQYRKLIVQLSKTVEQQMCANDWDSINFEQVPSVAMMRYRKAFERHGDNFQKYQDRVSKGEAKINSSQLTPGEIVNKSRRGHPVTSTEIQYLTNAWNALPDYLNGSTENWMPVIDVSGSMTTRINNSLECMDVAIGLGLYLAERNKGIFNNQFITFSSNPHVVDLKAKKFDSLRDKLKYIERSDWGTSTNIEAVFDLVLKSAVAHNIPQEQMPTKVVIFSDMEMNSCSRPSERLFTMINKKYQNAGYARPELVFWNLAGRDRNMTVNLNDRGACQISGYSPAILKNLTRLEQFTPMSVMLETIGNQRYDF